MLVEIDYIYLYSCCLYCIFLISFLLPVLVFDKTYMTVLSKLSPFNKKIKIEIFSNKTIFICNKWANFQCHNVWVFNSLFDNDYYGMN